MIKFYNTINRRKENFSPLDEDVVKLYTCGPTVYDYAHIGNFRAYVFEDVLRRTLEYFDYKVLHVMNITDIDDKTIRTSIKENKTLTEFTDYYTNAFFEDVKKLNIVEAHHYPRATEFIPQMIDMIKKLEKNGYTYTSEDGSVFFRISDFNEYGKLARLNPDNMKSGERVENDEYEKEEGRDFALWKGHKDEDGDVCWDSPWGKGRPGWHIECSAMSTHYLGEHFDIHCGGVDNIFPHHENEIAQSCCAHNSQFVNYWVHNEHLSVDGQKMSKSLGNFYTIRDLVNKGYSPKAIRYALLSSHYRQKLNFTFERLDNAQRAINKLLELSRRLGHVKDGSIKESAEYFKKTEKFLAGFNEHLSDDLNMSGALGEFFVWVNFIFKLIDADKISVSQSKDALIKLSKVDSILGVMENDYKIDDKIKELIEARAIARKEKNWEKSDEIRDKLSLLGIIVEDTPEGQVWKIK